MVGRNFTVRFMFKPDGGLVVMDHFRGKAKVVLHHQRDCRPGDLVAQKAPLAAHLDCLADLEQMGLQAEARDFAAQLCDEARRAP